MSTKRARLFALLAACVITLGVLPAAATEEATGQASQGVTRFEVTSREEFAEGREFGRVGRYERLDGVAHVQLDPTDRRNTVIVDLDKAPRNDAGMVEYSTPFMILQPVDLERGSGRVFYAVNNRGNKQALGYFNRVSSGPGINDPRTAADAGDGFLMRRGYTIVDAGWQGDVAAGNNRLLPDFPIATQPDSSPIVETVRIEYSDRTIPEGGTFTLPLEGSANFESYPAAITDTTQSTLTVRDCVDCEPQPIPDDAWAFGSCPSGADILVPTATDICLFDGFEADRLYELHYPATDPLVMGLGYAVTRDIASFLRHRSHDDAGNPNPLGLDGGRSTVQEAYGFGGSSTGMYMRDFLYLGFNEDVEGRQVFDAVWIHKPGTHRLFANVRFADPNTYSREDDRHDFLSTSYPPLTFAVTTDPISGIRDGILKRPDTDPLVFQTDTASEFWQFRASLNVTDGHGRPVEVPGNVRLYTLSSYQHSGNTLTTQFPADAGMCRNLQNPNYHGPTLRALLQQLERWSGRGTAPTDSRYGSVEDGTLVTVDEARGTFPAIPGVAFPETPNTLEGLDFGPLFSSTGGILTVLPPHVGDRYEVLVPATDSDGLDLAGIRPVEIRAPLGTNTGWNLRAPGHRPENLCGLSGSYIPFAETRAERLAAGDPRPSLEERYGNHGGYVRAVRRATQELVREGLLLREDAARFVREAAASDVLR
ncbi:MAG: hypothetical protein GEU78_16325 [Actinobacteria bacterium]|nr:hypothetical protein [Actinomycetota bacterium]